MSIQRLKLASIAKAWCDAIEANQAITDYCLEKYGKAPTIYFGDDPEEQPTCPYIEVIPDDKHEGQQTSPYSYNVIVGWSIEQGAREEVGRQVKLLGIQERDELGDLIYLAIADLDPGVPISMADYIEAPTDLFPQFGAVMRLQIRVTPAIGGNLSYAGVI
jgi:hypothetical protein